MRHTCLIGMEKMIKNMTQLYPWKNLFYVDNNKNFPVILGKSGEFSAVITLSGRDTRSSSGDSLIDDALSHMLILSEFVKEEGVYVHYDLTSVPYEYLRAPWFGERKQGTNLTINDNANSMVKLLSMKREERHKDLVEPIIFVTLSYQPPKGQLKWFKRFFFGGAKTKKANSVFEESLHTFNERVNKLARLYSEKLGVSRRLNADQLISYCHYVLTGLWVDMEAPSQSGAPFTYLIGVERNDDEYHHKFSVRTVNQSIHIRAVTLYGMPEQLRPELFEDIGLLGAGMRWSTRAKLVPQNKLRKEYTDQWLRDKNSIMSFRQNLNKLMTGTGEIDPIQEDLAMSARDEVKEISKSVFGAQIVSSVIIYRTNEQDADREAERVAEYLIGKRKPCRIEDYGTRLSFATTVPGFSRHMGSRDLLADYNAVVSLPCSLPYTGPDEIGGMNKVKSSVAWQFTINGVFPGRVDFGDGQNRHVTVTAPVRKGKSTKLQFIIHGMLAHMVNPFAYLIDVDVDKSASRIACTAMGGKVISFQDGTAAIQPFRHVDDSERRKVAKRWVKQCIRAHGMDDAAPHIDVMIDDAFNLLARFPYEERTVFNFVQFVQDHTIRQCMAPFATGDYAAHVGGERNIIGEPPYVVVDCTGLTHGDAHASCVIAALIDEITFTVSKHKGPVQLFIDEAAQTFPFISQSLKSAYKRWPKQGGGIVIVIHNPSDLDAFGEAGKIIVQNTGTWVCLSDEGAKENEAYTKHLRLSEFQAALLAEIKKGTFMIKVGNGVRVLQSDFSPLELHVLGQGGKEAEALANRLDSVSVSSDDFGVQLLKDGGFYEEAEWLAARANSNVVRFGIAAE